MRAIVILICHDHYWAVAECFHILPIIVLFVHLKTHDLYQVLDFIIFTHLFDTDIPYI